jgi:hypothetical protein
MDSNKKQQQDGGSAADSPAAAAAAGGGGSGGGGGGDKKRVRAGSYTTTHPKDPAAAGKELLEKLAQFINSLGGTLGDGWKCDVKMVTVSDSGDSGTCNATYTTPGGKRMRSRGEVAKFLGLEVPTGKGARGGSGGAAASGAKGGAAAGGHSGGSSAAAAAAADKAAGGHHDGAHHGSGHGHSKAAAAAAAAAAGGDDDEPEGMSKAEAYAAALARAQKLEADGVKLPLALKNGVVVESLGSIDLRPAFNNILGLNPPGFRAVLRDPAVGQFVSEIKSLPGVAFPQFVVTLVPDDTVLQVRGQGRTLT